MNKTKKKLYLLIIAIITIILVIVSIIIIFFPLKDKFLNDNENTINLFHWNIHYNCFTINDGNCDFKLRHNKKQNVKQFIMEKYFKNIDFANLIMFEENQVSDNKYKLKNPIIENINCDNNCEYLSLVQYCGKYNIPLNLVYNSKKWKLIDNVNTCINTNSSNTSDNNRPSIVGKFKSKKDPKLIVFVICIYMQHPWDLNPMKSIDILNNSLTQLKFNKDKDKLIFMSDTNLLGSEDHAQIFKDINVRANQISQQQYFLNEFIASNLTKEPITTQYFTPSNIKTCCNDSIGFKYDYDRIFTNFGTPKLTTIIPNDELEIKPIKYTNEMHRPLLISISY